MKLFRKLFITITALSILTLIGCGSMTQSFDDTDHFNVENRNEATIFKDIDIKEDGVFEDKWKWKGKVEKFLEGRFEVSISAPTDTWTAEQSKFTVATVEFVKKIKRRGNTVYKYEIVTARGLLGDHIVSMWTSKDLSLASSGEPVIMFFKYDDGTAHFVRFQHDY